MERRQYYVRLRWGIAFGSPEHVALELALRFITGHAGAAPMIAYRAVRDYAVRYVVDPTMRPEMQIGYWPTSVWLPVDLT